MQFLGKFKVAGRRGGLKIGPTQDIKFPLNVLVLRWKFVNFTRHDTGILSHHRFNESGCGRRRGIFPVFYSFYRLGFPIA